MSTNKEITLNIGGKDFTIKPLVMRKRDAVLEIVSSAFTGLNEKFDDISKAPQSEVIKYFISIASSKLADLYTLVLGEEKEWLLDNVTLENEVEILNAIWEVNNLPLLISQIAKFRGKKLSA